MFSLLLFPWSIYSIYLFQLGHFPVILKIAKIPPMVKKGDEQYMKNYRPIWILLVFFFSKILEKLTFNRLYSFVRKYNIFTDAQNGFRWGRSTESASRMKSCFKSHLVNRIQFVEIAKFGSNNTLHRYSSMYIETMYRVAQVSILGPVRFLLHVKVLPGFVECVQLDPYTDEACLFDNSLVLNTAKTC